MNFYIYFRNVTKQPELQSMQSYFERCSAAKMIERIERKPSEVYFHRLFFVNKMKRDFRYWRVRRYNSSFVRTFANFILFIFYSDILSRLLRPLTKILLNINTNTKFENGVLLTTTEAIPCGLRDRCKREGLIIFRVMSSWDHPAKLYDCYPEDRFLAWSKALADDLILCGVDSQRIDIVGAPLLAQTSDLNRSIKNYRPPEQILPYDYFLGTTANPNYVHSEIELISFLVKKYSIKNLIIRPYPTLLEQYKKSILSLKVDCKIDESVNGMDLANSKREMFKIARDADRVFHTGTTAGVEAEILYSNTIYLSSASISEAGFNNNQGGIQKQHHHIKYFLHNKVFDLMMQKDDSLIIVIQRIEKVINET